MFFPNLAKPLPVWQVEEPREKRLQNFERLAGLNEADCTCWLKEWSARLEGELLKRLEAKPDLWRMKLYLEVSQSGPGSHGGYSKWLPGVRVRCRHAERLDLHFLAARLTNVNVDLVQGPLREAFDRELIGRFLLIPKPLADLYYAVVPQARTQGSSLSGYLLNEQVIALEFIADSLYYLVLYEAVRRLVPVRLTWELEPISSSFSVQVPPDQLRLMAEWYGRALLNELSGEPIRREGEHAPSEQAWSQVGWAMRRLMLAIPLPLEEAYSALWSLVADRKRKCDLDRDRTVAIESAARFLLTGEDTWGLAESSAMIASYL